MAAAAATLLVTTSGELHVKSPRTRRRFRRRLLANLSEAVGRHTAVHRLGEVGAERLRLVAGDAEAAAAAAADTFGVHRVDEVVELPLTTLDQLADDVSRLAGARVTDRTFAVRVTRSGVHPFGSMDAQRVIGARLLARSAGVDLDHPEEVVEVRVVDDRAYVVGRSWPGAGGLPLGTQERVLALLSGGYDSAVAAWYLMRRGSPVDLLHVRLDCAQSEHALAVAHELWRRWGAGTRPLVWVLDFADVKERLLGSVPSRHRQVVLKQLMLGAADALADELAIPALVTGEAVGQVSSQTLRHLVEIERVVERPVLRPLIGFDKDEIIARARAIGTADLSARAREVCDLSDGPVAVAATRPALVRARAGLPDGLVAQALASRRVLAVEDWVPGIEPVPLVDAAPVGVPVVTVGQPLPDGPVALTGRGALRRASRLRAGGRDAVVVRRGRHEADARAS